jgi:thioredoxin-like negative regulator of GroEL
MSRARSRLLRVALLLPLLRVTATVGAATTVCRTGHAQDNSAAVEGLFAEGKKLAAEGKLAEACPKFLASYNLENRSGALLNLADCYEKTGQLATAWARFLDYGVAVPVDAGKHALVASATPR